MARRIELDVVRGVLLVMMTLTHLPTRLSAYASQPLGFVSAAEGFVFLSAFVASSALWRMLHDNGPRQVRQRAWARAVRLYGLHLGLLLFAFTIGASWASRMGRPALSNLLSYYLGEPGWSALGSILLLYQPPLLDILPMYIMFVAITPTVLELARSRGWSVPLGLSFALWVCAQLGARQVVYSGFAWLTNWPLPIEALGAFDWSAWQFLWILGLWLGARSSSPNARGLLNLQRQYVVALALGTAAIFFSWRHHVAGLGHSFVDASWLVDKWHLGPLRLINFAAWAVILPTLVFPTLARLRLGFLSLLGRASLPVFISHLFVALASLGLIVDDTLPLSVPQELGVLAAAFALMLLVASRGGAIGPARDPGKM
jgi:hypothetical protein